MYDAIVIGAGCAGAATATLLARKGHRVLLLDKAPCGDDTPCSQYIPPVGVACLQRWGLLEPFLQTNCPPIYTTRAEFGELSFTGENLPSQGVNSGLCPRRDFLYSILRNAAAAAGAEVRDDFTADELVREDGRICGVHGRTAKGRMCAEAARIVIGADGLRSSVARQVHAVEYQAVEPRTCIYYSCWDAPKSPRHQAEFFMMKERFVFTSPAPDGLTMAAISAPRSAFREFRADPTKFFLQTLKGSPTFLDRFASATQAGPFIGTADTPSFFRKPYGPGWALVGDAGYHRDPIVGQGVADALRHAELLSSALEEGFSPASLADYQQKRDRLSAPMFKLACEMACLEDSTVWPGAMLDLVKTRPHLRDRFLAAIAGTLSLTDFYSEMHCLLHRGAPSSPQQSRCQL